MSTQTIDININLNGLLGELQRSLQKVICLVATGLCAEIDTEPDELTLPTTLKLSFSKLGLNKDQFNSNYNEWVLSNGFRDAIENVSTFLESAHRVLSIWELVDKQNTGVPVFVDEWNKIFMDGGNKFHRLGLPDKLDHISIEHAIPINDSHKEQVLSINIARNCYVHRGGIVSDRDVNEHGTLTVKWSRCRAILKNEDGEQELILGQILRKESVLCIRFEENEKSFSVGEQLSFSVEEMSEIFWCFFIFGNELVKSISQFGESNGFLQATMENKS
ncbi:MAG: hypothetical protein ACXVNF_01310 [Neobacillus sp.]